MGTKEKGSNAREGLQFFDGLVTIFWRFDIFDQPNNYFVYEFWGTDECEWGKTEKTTNPLPLI